MAKRKRLTPAQPGHLGPTPAAGVRPVPLPGHAPIARVAGDSAAHAALEELSQTLASARAEGRMIETLPLAAIDEGYLVRDRLVQDEEEMTALMASLRARGQQTAIEVTRLAAPRGPVAYGLISGWRRLTALRRLQAETGEDRFATVRALVIEPETAQAAYVAMVEENEIRVNLSFYERARIAHRAMEQGVYPSRRAALQGLYGATTRSKRSKIGSFIGLVEALDGKLAHPTAISERLGLGLAREIANDPDFVSDLLRRLSEVPDRDAGKEIAILTASVAARKRPRSSATAPAAAAPTRRELPAPGIALRFDPARGRIELSGPGVDPALRDDLAAWLAAR